MHQPDQKSNTPGLKVWHMAVALVAVAIGLRLSLGALPEPVDQPTVSQTPVSVPQSPMTRHEPVKMASAPLRIEVLPFDLHGEVPGPLLTEILQRYLPDSTADHADTLRDTLPPSHDPRMIVIIPEEQDEAAMF